MIKIEYRRAKLHLKRIIRTFNATDIEWCLNKLFQDVPFQIIGDYPRVRENLRSWASSYMERWHTG